MEFNNVTLPCLLFPPDPTASVLSFIPPPQLHLMMGATNHPFNLLRSIMATNNRLQQFDKWCSKNSITRRGYDSNSLDGNNSSLLLKAIPKLRTAKLGGPEAGEDGELLAPPLLDPSW